MAVKSGIRWRVLVLASVLTLVVLDYCSGQTLTDRNTNTISDRSFQNTLLSRRPITPTRSSGSGRSTLVPGSGTNNGRIRVIQLPTSQTSRGQSGTRPRITIRPAQSRRQRVLTPDRMIALRQTRMGGTPDRRRLQASRRTAVVRPTSAGSGNRLRQTGPLATNRRRSMSRQTTRRVSRNRQMPRPGIQFRPGPLRRDPQTGLLIQSISAQPRRTVSNREPRALGPIPRCAANARYTCRAFPRNGDRRRARRCVGFCGQRRCVGLCLCACVTNRSTNRIQEQIGQGRPRDRLIDQLASGASPNDLNFTLDNSIITRMLAKSDLNTLIGPDGINQILRGEPPILRITEPPVSNISSLTATTQAPIDMGVPIPLGLTPAPLVMDPLLANMLTSGEGMGELTSEIGSEVLRIPSLTEFQRPGSGAVTSLNPQPPLSATNLDANFFGAILPMPTPISTSRDTQRSRGQQNSRDRTNVVVDPSLLDSGVIEPVRGFKSSRRPLTTLKAQTRVLENAFDLQTFDSISDVLSGAAGLRESGINMNVLDPGNSAVRGTSRDRRFFDGVLRSSGNQEPSEVAIMAAMMQSLGGAVDAVSAANSRNRTNSARTERLRTVSDPSTPMKSTNQTTGNLIENFLTGTVKATDNSMTGPTINECFAQGREFWCDPIGVWENTPGISSWCRTNCGRNSNLCDQARCDCKCVELERFRLNLENIGNL